MKYFVAIVSCALNVIGAYSVHAERTSTVYASARVNGATEDSACRYAQNDVFSDLSYQCRSAGGTLGSVDYGQCRANTVYPGQVEASVSGSALCRIP